MIDRIQNKNVSIPMEETASSQAVMPNESSIQDSEDRPAPKLFGVAAVEDSFENAQENNLMQQIGLETKSIIDPIGYPGEEWLWEEDEQQN